MDERQILDTLEMLARSQGFYGRVLNAYHGADEDEQKAFMEHLISKNFSDPVDLVMYFEC